ncbi:hypothetical protein HBH56_239130 [Parastagonospora nodorum]|nr:hypothetical protein HBH56_239130 [Parastagonospora nodorum]KAH3921618.1 hypothetical protein HBH54_236910 [Parastagonospora nodorum]KAH3957946.1 hypothetical protein HBH51_217380 [Parastagonospora nodorum]KAH3967378.1 hypothetical protein HBH52_186610 [Parastagonospora nodorum]KAH3993955.1 hypothetical protein HBI10_192120 [Parastagonospora nodorum]
MGISLLPHSTALPGRLALTAAPSSLRSGIMLKRQLSRGLDEAEKGFELAAVGCRQALLEADSTVAEASHHCTAASRLGPIRVHETLVRAIVELA